jgi:hypothetical protein
MGMRYARDSSTPIPYSRLLGVWPAFWTLGSGTWPQVRCYWQFRNVLTNDFRRERLILLKVSMSISIIKSPGTRTQVYHSFPADCLRVLTSIDRLFPNSTGWLYWHSCGQFGLLSSLLSLYYYSKTAPAETTQTVMALCPEMPDVGLSNGVNLRSDLYSMHKEAAYTPWNGMKMASQFVCTTPIPSYFITERSHQGRFIEPRYLWM